MACKAENIYYLVLYKKFADHCFRTTLFLQIHIHSIFEQLKINFRRLFTLYLGKKILNDGQKENYTHSDLISRKLEKADS